MNNFTDKLLGAVRSRSALTTALTALVIAVLVAFNVLIYALTSLLGLYIYTPDKDDLSLSGNTDSLFVDAIDRGKEVTVTFCMSEKEVKEHSTGSFVYKTAMGFAERYPELVKLRFVNFYTHRDDYTGELVDLTKYKTDLRGNETPLRSNTVIFSSGENYRVVTDHYSGAGFADFFMLDSSGSAYAYVGEEMIASMISWVLHDEHKTAYLTQNHGETADIAFSNLLACAGYYVDVINLRTSEIPEDAGLVIISNPTTDFERGAEVTVYTEIERLERYLAEGGNLYVALDPYARRMPVLEGFLGEWGITVSGEEVDGSYYRELVKDPVQSTTMNGMTFVAGYADGEIASVVNSEASSYRDGGVILREVSRLEVDSALGAEALLTSSESSVTMLGEQVKDSAGSYAVAAMSERQTEEGNKARIFVVSGVFLTGTDALVNEGYSNKDFVFSLLNNLFGSLTAPYGCGSVIYNTGTLQGLTMGTARVFAAVILAIPAVLAVLGFATIIRRKYR